MNIQKADKLAGILGLCGGLCYLLVVIFWNRLGWLGWAFMGLGTVCALACALVMFLYHRCPHCKKRLTGYSIEMPEVCPHCGGRIGPGAAESKNDGEL